MPTKTISLHVVQSRLWRTQIHVQSSPDPDGFFDVILPAWQCNDAVKVSILDIEPEHRTYINPGFVCYARANLGCIAPSELYITNWSIEETVKAGRHGQHAEAK